MPEAANSPEDVRELIFRDYRIVYLVETDTVHILALIHGARDLQGMAKKPWG